jgi:iron complex outermembrane receptor protein
MMIAKRHFSRAAALGSAACGLALSAHALAQAQTPAATPAAPVVLKEMVVHTQKRSEKAQKVPVTVAAFDAATLKRSNVTSVADLSTVVPGLVYNDVAGYGVPFLRGVGTTSTGPGFENPVATYVDGVYYATQAGDLSQLNDIRYVEVDKGPQGTLFGRNSTGGAIQIDTLDPSSTYSGFLQGGYGSYDTYQGSGYVTGGLAPNLSANLAVNWNLQNHGYGRNLANGDPLDRNGDFSVRNKFLFTPDSATRVTLSFDYDRSTSIPTFYPAPGTIPQFAPPIAGKRDAYGSPQPFEHATQYGFGLNVKHDFGPVLLTSITAVRRTVYDSLFDSTLTAEPGTTFFIEGKEPHTQASQEFQFTSTAPGPLEWVGGLYYFYERAGFNEPTTIGGSSFATFGLPGGILQAPDSIVNSAAVYGQGSYHFTPATALTVGLRYTNEYKSYQFTQTIPAFDSVTALERGRDFSSPTWRVALQHSLTQDVMSYVSYNRGVKSGGFTYNPLVSGTQLQTIKPEQLDAFETGVKSELFDHRIRLNGAAFYYLYKNVQTTIYPNGSAATVNAPSAHVYGLDLDSEFAVTSQLNFTAGLEALHATYASFPAYFVSTPLSAAEGGGTVYASTPSSVTGNHLPRTPAVTATIAADYTQPLPFGKLVGNVTESYDSGWFAEPDNRLKQPAYNVVNLSMALSNKNDTLVLQLYCKNLLNETYAVYEASQTNGDFVQYAPPLTVGFTLTKKF